ncbi:hypothetical protein L1987_72797 [Smallanthus sonchifolius]|uniref:Uncharacterized protein n=1 Tax=Smallanthus sonchifolius TaxID=185202 RepID=A0ACB9AW81_9ASTR|nr:hypothetical protein L1987_72797 [Smallanthus sonchifolius]
MKCLISLNSPELVKKFIGNKETWKDHLISTMIWEGQEMQFERVAKLRTEGIPIVLREEKIFREIAGLYGKVIEPFEFSWDRFDVSSGSCLVLHQSGNRIDEEILLNWKDRSYPVWVKEVEHVWPPAPSESPSPVMNGEGETGMVDVEEGEIRPELSQPVGVGEFPIMDHPEMQKEGESSTCMGKPKGLASLHGEHSEVHVVFDSLCTPRNLRNNTPRVIRGVPLSGSQMGHLSRASSRKRPRLFRSPISKESTIGLSLFDDTGNRIDIPPFPDLNNPMPSDSASPGESIPMVQVQSVEPAEEEGDSMVPETMPVGVPMDMDNDVTETIAVGECVGIHVGEFEDQVRLLIQGEGAIKGNQ